MVLSQHIIDVFENMFKGRCASFHEFDFIMKYLFAIQCNLKLFEFQIRQQG